MASSEAAAVRAALGLFKRASAAQQLQGIKQLLAVTSSHSDDSHALQPLRSSTGPLDRLIALAVCAVEPRSAVVAQATLKCLTQLTLCCKSLTRPVLDATTREHIHSMAELALNTSQVLAQPQSNPRVNDHGLTNIATETAIRCSRIELYQRCSSKGRD